MNKQMKWGIVLQYLQMAVSIVIQLIYTPVMIRILGDNEYGIYNLVASIISYLGLLSLGFGASYIRFYSKYKAKNDEQGIRKLNGLFMTVFLIMGAIALCCGVVASLNAQIFFNSTYSTADIKLAKILMMFLTINLTISFPASVFISYITAHEKFVFQKLINIGKTILSPLLCIIALFMGYGSIGMVIVTTGISLLIDVINVVFCIKKLNMRFAFGKWEKGLFKEIAIFSVFIAINQIIDQINWQTDKIILGKMINGTAVAIYAVASTINTMYLNFSTAISSVFTPQINKIENECDEDEKHKRLNELFIKVGRIQFFVIMLILTGFIFFGKFFITKWAGVNYEKAYYIALWLMLPVTVPLIQNLGIEIQRAKNKHKFRSYVYLTMAIVNVFISIWFCHIWGIVGVAIGTALALIICNGIIMNIYYHRVTKLNIVKFWSSILKILPALILPCCLGVSIMIFYNIKSMVGFGILVIAYTLIYLVSMYLIGLNKEEKSWVKGLFIKLKKQTKEKDCDTNNG